MKLLTQDGVQIEPGQTLYRTISFHGDIREFTPDVDWVEQSTATLLVHDEKVDSYTLEYLFADLDTAFEVVKNKIEKRFRMALSTASNNYLRLKGNR